MFYLPNKEQLTSDPVLILWNGGALISFLLPLMVMVISRCVFVGDGNNDNNNNNNDGNNNNNGYRWWHFWGNNNNNNNNNNDNGDDGGGGSQDQGIPWWWVFGRQEGDPEEEGKGGMVFVYLWSSLLFVSLVLYGNFVFRRNSNYEGLQGALFMFTNMALMVLVLVSGLGGIEVEGRELEETGWYGQFSVCIFFTCLLWVIHGIVFVWLLRKRAMRNSESNYGRSVGAFGLFKDPMAEKEESEDPITSMRKAFQYERGDV